LTLGKRTENKQSIIFQNQNNLNPVLRPPKQQFVEMSESSEEDEDFKPVIVGENFGISLKEV
jgi:hypothetical protein